MESNLQTHPYTSPLHMKETRVKTPGREGELPLVGEQGWRSGESRVGTVVRALASHQCGSGSNPGPGVMCGLSLLLVLALL